MNDVTALIKTFLRDDVLFLCIESLRSIYPEIPIIVADDGRPSYVKESFMRGNNVEYRMLPFNGGKCKGMNFLIDICRTPYCLIGDDDFYYTPKARLDDLRKLMTIADLAGGAAIQNGEVTHFEGFFYQSEKNGAWRLEPLRDGDTSELDGVLYQQSGVVLNFFIARTEALRYTRWDDNIMMHEHGDFFLRFMGDGHTVVYAPNSQVHHNYRPPRPAYKDDYAHFRRFNRTDKAYLARKWNLKGAEEFDASTNEDSTTSGKSAGCPLPNLRPDERVVSCRHWYGRDGTAYWIRIYDEGDALYKQATLDLATRESHVVRMLNGPHFPRLIDEAVGPGYSTITIEKIHGAPPAKCDPAINADVVTLGNFLIGCIDILRQLRGKGITHRQILRENLILSDGKPVLVDFTWAVSRDDSALTPAGLQRSPEGEFCDVYSMGKVFAEVSDRRRPAVDAVIKLMTDEFADSRILDLDILELLFGCACGFKGSDTEPQAGEYRSVIRDILDRAFRTKLIHSGFSDRETQWTEKAAREITGIVPWETTIILVDSAQTEIHRWLEGRSCIPMMERDGRYWGTPADDRAAISEVERLRALGAGFVVFAWPALWWLEHYSEMARWLRRSFGCALENERLVIFDLRHRHQD